MTKVDWHIDTANSRLEFSVRYLMISNVKGTFNDFFASIVADPEDLTDARIEFTIDVNSIDTHIDKRDDHLRSEDFFNVEKYPEILFKATEIKKKEANKYDLTGDFTIIGKTKPVTFDITFEGQGKDPIIEEEVASFTGHTKINREDFGLNWNVAIEAGGVLVSEEVQINIDIQMRR